jgi:hypothetical protein
VRRVAVVVVALVLLAGCGGSRRAGPPPSPRLPHALGHSWSRQANAVAAALAANDGCTAQQLARRLRAEVIEAINAGRIPQRLLEPLTSAVNALPARITCTPPPAPDEHGHGRDHGHGHGHDQGGEGG